MINADDDQGETYDKSQAADQGEIVDKNEPNRAGGVVGDPLVAAPDGQPTLEGGESGEDRLRKIAEEIERGEHPSGETVRTLLSWFHVARRGSRVVAVIRTALEAVNLATEPDFDSAYLDSVIHFVSTDAQPAAGATPVLDAKTEGVTSRVADPPQATAPAEPPNSVPLDPSFRVSKLAAANRVPVSVTPDAPLSAAITIMMTNEYSQVPVLTGPREVKGVVTWQSVATRFALQLNGDRVRDFMEPAEILPSAASLFSAITHIALRQYVLVQAPDKRIVGIITASDLSLQFRDLTEPFLLLSEIENELRGLLRAKFSVTELALVKDPADTSRSISSVHDMTFGEYIRLLENPDHWGKLGLALDRGVFVARLRDVGRIRNDVMHFDPDGVLDEQVTQLRTFSRMLQRLRELGAV